MDFFYVALSVLHLKDAGITSTSVEKSMHIHERDIKITEYGILFVTIITGINAYDSNVLQNQLLHFFDFYEALKMKLSLGI